jgi:hypothetical protein
LPKLQPSQIPVLLLDRRERRSPLLVRNMLLSGRSYDILKRKLNMAVLAASLAMAMGFARIRPAGGQLDHRRLSHIDE